jgi:hypothetical protein
LCVFFNKISDKSKQDLSGTKGEMGREVRGGGQRGEMTQTMYAHVNK